LERKVLSKLNLVRAVDRHHVPWVKNLGQNERRKEERKERKERERESKRFNSAAHTLGFFQLALHPVKLLAKALRLVLISAQQCKYIRSF
jgi:hypothetical protein